VLATLGEFKQIAESRIDTQRVAQWEQRIVELGKALEENGWDGRWYLRAFFDDGSMLGSAQNEECRIDAIAQSWAVLSGGPRADRAVMAMDESYQQLVRADDKLMALFTPPFDKTDKDPGYIKAYPRGIRENGGQYTHGVIWSIFAHAKLGQSERAAKLFSLLNPINHALNESDATTYRVEPYVIAADVYSVAPHVGRGGWTWYTGSAAWMHRAGLEAILGFTREGDKLRVKPCIPDGWNEFSITMRFGNGVYQFTVTRNIVSDPLPSDVEAVAPGEFLISLRRDEGTRQIILGMVPTPNAL
jgi:cyclic beta-1,2-glucan synthetase